MDPLIAAAFVLYLAIVLFFGYRYRFHGKHDDQGYLISNRSLGAIEVAVSSTATTFSAATVFSAFGLTYYFGSGAWTAWMAWPLQVLLFAAMAPAIWQLAKSKNYLSHIDLIRDRIGAKTGWAYALFSVIFMVAMVAAACASAATILDLAFGLNKYLSSTLVAAVVVAYMWFGGFRSVVKTDIRPSSRLSYKHTESTSHIPFPTPTHTLVCVANMPNRHTTLKKQRKILPDHYSSVHFLHEKTR